MPVPLPSLIAEDFHCPVHAFMLHKSLRYDGENIIIDHRIHNRPGTVCLPHCLDMNVMRGQILLEELPGAASLLPHGESAALQFRSIYRILLVELMRLPAYKNQRIFYDRNADQFRRLDDSFHHRHIQFPPEQLLFDLLRITHERIDIHLRMALLEIRYHTRHQACPYRQRRTDTQRHPFLKTPHRKLKIIKIPHRHQSKIQKLFPFLGNKKLLM